MKCDPTFYHRRSIRLRGYDYGQKGAYFLTLCVHQRQCLLGQIIEGEGPQDRPEMHLNDSGKMITRWYHELEKKFQDIQCGDFVCMPNHVHCIVHNVGTAGRSGAGPHVGKDLRTAEKPAGSPLQSVVRWYKTMTTNEYIRSIKELNWPAFSGKLWQRNYWEHVIRDDQELGDIREYIYDNPARWGYDQLNPDRRVPLLNDRVRDFSTGL